MIFGDLGIWLPPVWLLSTGVALGLVLVAIGYGLTAAVSRRSFDTLWGITREGFLMPVFGLALFLAGVALIASFKVPYGNFFGSLLQLPGSGRIETETVVVAGRADSIELTSRSDEVQRIGLHSDQPLTIRPLTTASDEEDRSFTISPNQAWVWAKSAGTTNPLQSDGQVGFTVSNATKINAKLDYFCDIEPDYPEAIVIIVGAAFFVGLVGFYLLLRLALPKLSAVAITTAKEAFAQPLFYLLLAIGAFALLIFVYLPYNTLGEDIKMLKDMGLTLTMLLATAIAVWTASTSIADEIEGRTALTVLSKPIGRAQFLIGKYVGILMPAVMMYLFLGTLFLVTVAFKSVHDSREMAQLQPTWQLCTLEMVSVAPGLVLGFFETMVMAAISVAISTRLPMLANLMICITIYVLGHLVPMIANSDAGSAAVANVPVRFVAQFFATIFPVLDHFNIQASIAGGATVSLAYLGWALLYCVLYCTAAMLLALALFEDRDLA